MPEPIVISEYDPGWPREFDRLRRRAAAALGSVAVAVEHVGSTSVPGCAAKPVVDLDVVVRSPDEVPVAIRLLATIGYAHRGDLGVSGREAFRRPEGEPRHHLYVVVAGNEAHLRHIRLRDHLRSHPEDARAYGELKKALAGRYVDDRVGYTEAKSEFIARLVGDL